jgi:hypothetical protein
MKEIILTQGKVALVDDEDYKWLNKYKWCAHKNKRYWYAKRNSGRIFMHREIMKTPIDLMVDHKDTNGLNNQRYNLRNCTNRQNLQNGRSNSTNKGTTFDKVNNKFLAQIRVGGRQIKLGRFITEKEAALAYNNAAIILHGEFANLNQI